MKKKSWSNFSFVWRKLVWKDQARGVCIVKRTIEKKGLNVKSFNEEGWWTRFKQRNTCLLLRTADPLAMVHSDCARQEVFDDYFKLLDSTLDSLKLSGKPQCIYNMDETGMPLDAKQL